MKRELLSEMKALLGEGAGREKATALLTSAVDAASKQLVAMQASRVALQAALAPLDDVFRYAHEFSEGELKRFKKSVDYLQDSIASIDKHLKYQTSVLDALTKLRADVAEKDGPEKEVEPDPNRPLQRTVLQKPELSAEDWQLYTLDHPEKSAAVALKLNKALWKAMSDMEDDLVDAGPKAPHGKLEDIIVDAYLKHLDPELRQYKKYGSRDAEVLAVAHKQMVAAAQKVLGSPVKFTDLW